MPWFGWTWVALQATLMASVPLVVGGWRAAAVVAVPLVATNVGAVSGLDPVLYPVPSLYIVCYWTILPVCLAAALYGSARLVRLLGELQETRAELAALAVGRGRPRGSRGPHHPLGPSPAAREPQGGPAIRPPPRRPAAAPR